MYGKPASIETTIRNMSRQGFSTDYVAAPPVTSSAYVNGMNQVMSNAVIVAKRVTMKKFCYARKSLTYPLIVPGSITPRFMIPEAKA